MAEMQLRNISVLAYAQGFTLWHVRAPCSLADALAPGYLKLAAGMIETGDMVLVTALDGGATVFVQHSSGARYNGKPGTETIAVRPMLATSEAAA